MGYYVAVIEGAGRNVCRDMSVYEKRVIEAFSRKELLDKLRSIDWGRSVVSVKPRSVESARVAARDSRVDTIIVDEISAKFMDKHQFNLMKQFVKPLEFSLNNWLRMSLKNRTLVYRALFIYTHRYKLPIIASSGASSWNEAIHPRSIIDFLTRLLNVPPMLSTMSVTAHPRDILVRKKV